ncbi:MAG: hypothetical protein ACI92I_000554 [Acidimicrobiales bacterium]|jgi:hypothetical protein
MTQKWNLQDIKPAQPRKRRTPVNDTNLQKRESPLHATRKDASDVMSIDIVDGNKRKRKTLLYAIIIFIIVVGGGLLSSSLMEGAKVEVRPIHKEPNVNASFEAFISPQPNELTYEIMTHEEAGESQVEATGQEEVKKQSEGTIIVYNKHQSKSLRLVTNTRFESEGLTFRIKDSAVIPGYTKDESGNIVPGTIIAEVFADEVGEQYNLGPSRFTIPGFQGEPEFDNLYAESIETFQGGFDGMRFIIDDSQLQTAQQSLRLELRNLLLKKVEAEKPAGFILFTDAVTFTYESLPAVEYGDNLATIKEKVIMRIPLFKDEDFAKFLAVATIPGYEGEDVRIAESQVIDFTYSTASTSAYDISKDTSISFRLTGRPQIIWEYDVEKLKTDLLDKNKTALKPILSGYPAIEKAEAIIRPFWKTKFPRKIEEIEIYEIID